MSVSRVSGALCCGDWQIRRLGFGQTQSQNAKADESLGISASTPFSFSFPLPPLYNPVLLDGLLDALTSSWTGYIALASLLTSHRINTPSLSTDISHAHATSDIICCASILGFRDVAETAARETWSMAKPLAAAYFKPVLFIVRISTACST